MHAGIVHKSSLVDIHVEALVCLELKRCLNSGRREHVLVHAPAVHFPDLGEAAACVVIFLSIIVARNPPRCDISRHGELRMLFLEHKIDK